MFHNLVIASSPTPRDVLYVYGVGLAITGLYIHGYLAYQVLMLSQVTACLLVILIMCAVT